MRAMRAGPCESPAVRYVRVAIEVGYGSWFGGTCPLGRRCEKTGDTKDEDHGGGQIRGETGTLSEIYPMREVAIVVT
jgi:hypothetical protein